MTEDRLNRYKQELLRWNEKINLVGPEARDNIDAHIEEALAASAILTPRGEVLDFGSGGGLPAIPMAIVSPEAHFHLVESDQKKWAFLKHVVRECELNAVVHGDRLARVLTQLPPGLRFSLVTSRAVGKPHEWLPLVAPWMADGGRVGLFQGSSETPAIRSFMATEAFPLRRGTLVTLTFHVEQP